MIFRLTIPRAGTGPAEADNQTCFPVNDGLSFRINDPIRIHIPEPITTGKEREPGRAKSRTILYIIEDRDADELASQGMTRGAKLRILIKC